MNRVCLVVRLGKDPELRDANGTSVCNMRAVFNTRRKVDGEWTDVANWVNVTAFGRLADNCAQYLAKGRECAVDGRLEVREYDKSDGTKGISVDVVADSIKFIGGRDAEPSDDPGFVGGGDDQDIPFAPTFG